MRGWMDWGQDGVACVKVIIDRSDRPSLDHW